MASSLGKHEEWNPRNCMSRAACIFSCRGRAMFLVNASRENDLCVACITIASSIPAFIHVCVCVRVLHMLQWNNLQHNFPVRRHRTLGWLARSRHNPIVYSWLRFEIDVTKWTKFYRIHWIIYAILDLHNFPQTHKNALLFVFELWLFDGARVYRIRNMNYEICNSISMIPGNIGTYVDARRAGITTIMIICMQMISHSSALGRNWFEIICVYFGCYAGRKLSATQISCVQFLWFAAAHRCGRRRNWIQ